MVPRIILKDIQLSQGNVGEYDLWVQRKISYVRQQMHKPPRKRLVKSSYFRKQYL